MFMYSAVRCGGCHRGSCGREPLKMLVKLLFVCLAIISTVAQSEDELEIPVENDNLFPPDNHMDDVLLEGSGLGILEEPKDITTEAVPILEDVQATVLTKLDEAPITDDLPDGCPKPCVCNIEGGSDNFVVNCAGYDLTEFPSPLDPRTTKLDIQNNKITEVPKEVAELKNLKVLNANSNNIMDLVSGSISELPELRVLNLGNNRLIEFPKDLKNSFGLTKLEELDLGGNDMRTPFTTETFSNFKSLKKVTLPTSTSELVEDLCGSLKESLDTVCTESCNTQAFECPDAPQTLEDELMDVILPATLIFGSSGDDNVDPVESTGVEDKKVETTIEEAISSVASESVPVAENTTPDDFSLRSAVNQASDIAPLSTIIEAPKEASNNTEAEVAVGATTSSTKTGGVDKSVIAIIVAGMVVVVAGVTIKKNWSSIKNRCSSSPNRAANDRTATTNGAAPEEVPLQEKLPV